MDKTYLLKAWTGLTLFRMGFFPFNLSHISYNGETRHSYTLPKEDPKIYESGDTPLEFC